MNLQKSDWSAFNVTECLSNHLLPYFDSINPTNVGKMIISVFCFHTKFHCGLKSWETRLENVETEGTESVSHFPGTLQYFMKTPFILPLMIFVALQFCCVGVTAPFKSTKHFSSVNACVGRYTLEEMCVNCNLSDARTLLVQYFQFYLAFIFYKRCVFVFVKKSAGK